MNKTDTGMITAFTYTGLFTVQRETHRCSVEVLRLQLQVINVNTETAKQQFYNVYIHPNVPRRQHQQDLTVCYCLHLNLQEKTGEDRCLSSLEAGHPSDRHFTKQLVQLCTFGIMP